MYEALGIAKASNNVIMLEWLLRLKRISRMGIKVTGLGSGLDYDSWIKQLVAVKQADIDTISSKVKAVETQKTALSTLETSYQSLLSSIETFTKALSTSSVFNQKAATSSDTAVGVSVSSSASAQSIKVEVLKLATATTAQSNHTVASYVDSNTTVSQIKEGVVEEGYFSVYVDGVKQKIQVGTDETNDTLGEIVDSINNLTGVSASLSADGKLTITGENGSKVSVGSSSDTSNFVNVMGLVDEGLTGTYTSSNQVYDTDTSAKLTEASFRNSLGDAIQVKAGTFTIGDKEFEVTADKTLDSLVDEINSSDAGVSAYWDASAGKMVLTSNDQGAVNINIEAGTSNFTDVMGFTTSTWDSETGERLTTSLVEDTQTLGTNAKVKINGTTITSASNTVTSDISGLTGVTLTLNKETTDAAATVSVTQDTSKVETALTAVVNALNTVITQTDKATGTSGYLYGETILNSLRNNLRTTATASISGKEGFTNLANIGITTGAIGTGVDANTNQLQINTTKLEEALKKDPDAVKKLLLGDSATDTKGVLTKLEKSLNNALDEVSGFFTTKEKSFEKQIGRMEDKSDRLEKGLEDYQKQLEAKFYAMDQLISSLQKSASIFDSYFNNDNKDDK